MKNLKTGLNAIKDAIISSKTRVLQLYTDENIRKIVDLVEIRLFNLNCLNSQSI